MDPALSHAAAPVDDLGEPSAAVLDPAGVDALVETLRSVRLTVLIGAAGSGRSRLLREAVRPLLHRRADDACARPAPQAEATEVGGIDLLERRRRRTRPRELVVWCDRWDGSPTERLQTCLDEAVGAEGGEAGVSRAPLALRVEALGAERGARLLFVFDHADRLVPTPADASGAAAEYDTLLNTLCGLGPSVHVLVSARDDALPPSVRSRLDRHDTRVLRLPDRRRADARASPPPVAAAAWVPPPSASDDRPLQRDDVYESIIARLAAIDGGEREPPWGGAAAASAGEDAAASDGAEVRAPAAQADDLRRRAAAWRANAAAQVAGWRLPGWPLSRAGLAGVALLASAVVGGLLWQDRSPSTERPAPSARTLATARFGSESADVAPAAGQTPAPALPEATADRTNAAGNDLPPSKTLVEPGSDAQVAVQLWHGLAAQGGPVAGGDATVALSAAQSVAIVSYDGLRALAAAPGTAKTVRVVAPLYTEDLQVIVRADSPLTFLHEIRGRRINIGAAQSRRSATAAAVYRQLFDAPLSSARTSTADLGPALAELLDARSIDAIVLAEPQPSAWLTGLPEVQRRGLKLLRLAAGDPSTRRALRAYLPATLHADLGHAAQDVPTLGVMSFLIAKAAPAGAGRPPVAASAAQALCQALSGLRRDGHPVWRGVDPALRLPLPLPYDDSALAVLENCEANRSATAPRTSISVSQADSNPKGEHE